MKAVAPHCIAEFHQSFGKINQQRIAPADAAVAPLAEMLPGATGKRRVILLSVQIAITQLLLQLWPCVRQRGSILHSAEIEATKCWLQVKKCRRDVLNNTRSEQCNKSMMQIPVTRRQSLRLGFADFFWQRIGSRHLYTEGLQIPRANQQSSAPAFQDLCR